MNEQRVEPPWEDIDPGIVKTVRALWEAGFEPTDSGDGLKRGMECAVDYPHVFMTCPRELLVERADQLLGLAQAWLAEGRAWVQNEHGITQTRLMPHCVQANYCPIDGVSVLLLVGVMVVK